MKRSTIVCGLFSIIALAGLLFQNTLHAQAPRQFYELKIYHYTGEENENRLDQYLRDALVPGLHRAGIKTVGVFKSSPDDTATIRKVYVLTPYPSLNYLDRLDGMLS